MYITYTKETKNSQQQKRSLANWFKYKLLSSICYISETQWWIQ